MTIRVALNHNTYYNFDRAVELSKHVVRLRPAPHCRTPIHSYSLKIKPENHFINWQQDAFGNFLASIVFPEKSDHLSIEVEVLADMIVINPFDFFLEEYAEHFPFKYPSALKKELQPYLETIACGKPFINYTKAALRAALPTRKVRTIDFLVSINQCLQKDIDYCIRLEPGVQTPQVTLKKRTGSCRDSAWLMVQILRHLGIAARFASGYLVQLTADEKALDGPSGTEKDFTDLHAWCEVFLPGAGWVGLDPTSGLFAGEGHIPLACTPSPSSAAPIEGATDECEVEFNYSNDVSRFHEDPRVTKPYSEAAWQQVLKLGSDIDQQLETMDVRLTMGGEPTFVSIDDMESAQWNTDALGDDKLSLAKGLLLKLRDQFAANGLLHYGQGKWYPGEEVPRWALGLFWLKDGQPLWQNAELLARIDKDYGADINKAQSFASELCRILKLEASSAQPAYEDALHYLMQELQLPQNIDSEIANAKSSLDRQRLAAVLAQGLDQASGFVIPLERALDEKSWCSNHWSTRREKLTLIPGDSPMGLRLPLGELSSHKDDPKVLPEADPFAVQQALPQEPIHTANTASQTHREQAPKPASGRELITTALCVQPRDGKLHVFLPPLEQLTDYLALIQAIESVAKTLSCPVVLEGYTPPKDARLTQLLVTPDPGVIEVNVHPASNWDELVSTTTELYHAARESRLCAEKFMLDGRHTGTGGGNHMTLGGKTPADSPFLRRPDLLRSLITFWQHHPSLSYLFSGTFIGPTSQAPRMDEGRDEMLYELEIAFQQLPDGESQQPWLIDRILRNLLIDITGNTHRAEFCIDKLYAPGTTSGRQGLLEFRGFEMPPHPQMSLVQALLIRALVSLFWQKPYKHNLVRWGTALHDKFMLPHFIWRDVLDVVEQLQQHGIQFDPEWLRPFEEFRFPHYGRVKLDDIDIELRWAIEPWHVLGEEVGSFGTARYVDSSVERLQVRLTGLTPERYVLACNGRRVPLHATGRGDEFIAGIRYRAWAPPSALHPTIGTHVPLVFDLIDTWNGRSVGGCTYHVSHPGGLSYETYPINAFEAESRRVNRFSREEHSQGPYQPQPAYIPKPSNKAERQLEEYEGMKGPLSPPAEESSGEYPFTLDLRRAARFI
ncbi:DUF2126 domain-containing protein [Agaribacterium sp. ZY112]|uniref:transglutaminase family protein n=1 Tax=Agaribacterium sp. ZY112 TaxID=3233574 RepID=UPI003525341E